MSEQNGSSVLNAPRGRRIVKMSVQFLAELLRGNVRAPVTWTDAPADLEVLGVIALNDPHLFAVVVSSTAFRPAPPPYPEFEPTYGTDVVRKRPADSTIVVAREAN